MYFFIFFLYYDLSQDIEYNSLSYTVVPYGWFIHSMYNSSHLLILTFQSIPPPPHQPIQPQVYS